MRRTIAGLAALIVSIVLLAGCASVTSSVKSVVSSITASHSGSAAPTTPPPTTAAPTTAAPTTAAPTTAAPTTPATTSSAAVAPATATTSPSASSSTSPWVWVLVALGIVVVAGLLIWAIAAHRRRSRMATDWRSRVIDAYAKGSALHDAMAAAETPGALGAPDAGLRWADIQRRADDYGQLLYAMQQAAPGDQERIQVSDVIASLQAARSAMDAERSARVADPTLAGIARDRLSFFAGSLNSLREPDVRPF